MKNQKSDLLTAANISKELGIPDSKVKKAIQELGIKPTAKKGACNYYSREVLNKIKKITK